MTSPVWARYTHPSGDEAVLQADEESRKYYEAKGFVFLAVTDTPGVAAPPAAPPAAGGAAAPAAASAPKAPEPKAPEPAASSSGDSTRSGRSTASYRR